MIVGRVWRCGQLRLDGIGEDPLADRILLALPQKLRRTLGQDDGAHAHSCFGVTQREHAQLLAVEGAAHLQRTGFPVEVPPHKAADFAPPQAGGQLGVEKVVPDFVLFDNGKECIQLPVVQHLLFAAALPGDGSALCWIAGDEVCLDGILHGQMEHAVDAAHGVVGKLGTLLRMFIYAPLFFQPAIHPLNVLRGDQGDLFVS
ncbi:hypothetical protein SDC9_131333 [bioreactor metagenome]|uniref:Uncharacterized protein n=1 Tax=bioreactor metagenome TaxID=1076179 RepID=A0A645D6K3_9ZZZZ